MTVPPPPPPEPEPVVLRQREALPSYFRCAAAFDARMKSAPRSKRLAAVEDALPSLSVIAKAPLLNRNRSQPATPPAMPVMLRAASELTISVEVVAQTTEDGL
ncbi:hypothetical protein ACNJYD_19785 [Bradyrhizobium sp. DASA03005]|uniref:hypothetical protein n=1 Tax=Bradyrhizobium sp. SPXBL-02 TaxID=3395912 RepID=UPI003F72C4C8